MMKVHLELFPLLVRGLTDGKSERLVLEKVVGDRASVQDLVDQVVGKWPALAQALLEPESRRPRREIIVSVNDEVLPLVDVLDTRLRDGDRVFLLMAMPGG